MIAVASRHVVSQRQWACLGQPSILDDDDREGGATVVVDYTEETTRSTFKKKGTKSKARQRKQCKKEMKECKMSTVTQTHVKQHSYMTIASYPVTPPEGWALELPEFWDLSKTEKLYKSFWGEKQRLHTHTHPS